MATTNQSIEQLTAALQELTADLANAEPSAEQSSPQSIPTTRLNFSEGVEAFLESSRQHAELTRGVSVAI